ncbi:MAG TPA: hypothetical protein VJP05_09395 [Acidimicrobiia bacterium]|nr:hypothetical protein [Acidimicrobiia bacterium]
MWYSTETVLALYRSMQGDRARRMRPLARRRRRSEVTSDVSRVAALAVAR